MSFKKYIQLILVNNGSTDQTEGICERYAKKYPNNIIYKKIDVNGGPSLGRKVGIELCDSHYIAFLDSDDYWDKDAFVNAIRWFNSHYNEIDFVSCRMRCFGSMDQWEGRDYRFGESHVVNLDMDYCDFQQNMASSIFKAEVFKKIPINESIYYSEDSTFLIRVTQLKGRYGVVRESVYYYRKHEGSVIENRLIDRRWYFDSLEETYKILVDAGYDHAPNYVQAMALGELSDRFVTKMMDLNADEKIRYIDLIKKILKGINSQIIWNWPILSYHYKVFALLMKKGCDNYFDGFEHVGRRIFIDNIEVTNFEWSGFLTIRKLERVGNMIHLDGIINTMLPKEKIALFAETDKWYHSEVDYYDDSIEKYESFESIKYIPTNFQAKVPVDTKTYWFVFRYDNVEIRPKINYVLNNNCCGNHIFENDDISIDRIDEIYTEIQNCPVKESLSVESNEMKQVSSHHRFRELIRKIVQSPSKKNHKDNQ